MLDAALLMPSGLGFASAVAVGEQSVLMSAHQVSGLETVVLIARDGSSVNGKVSWRDESVDLALVETGTRMRGALSMRETPLTQKEEVYLIAYQNRQLRVCSGVAVEPRATLAGRPAHFIGGTYYSEPGTSGGALVDRDGRLVGIQTNKQMGAVNFSRAHVQCFRFPCNDRLVISGGSERSYARPVTIFCERYGCAPFRRR